jgi:hypothetical protein
MRAVMEALYGKVANWHLNSSIRKSLPAQRILW